MSDVEKNSIVQKAYQEFNEATAATTLNVGCILNIFKEEQVTNFNQLYEENQKNIAHFLINCFKNESFQVTEEFKQVSETLELLSRNSYQFCLIFIQNSNLNTMFDIIKTIQQMEKMSSFEDYFKSLIETCVNLSRFTINLLPFWKECDAVEILSNFTNDFINLFEFDLNWLRFLALENLSKSLEDPNKAFDSTFTFEDYQVEASENFFEEKEAKFIIGYKSMVNLGFTYFIFINEPDQMLKSEQSQHIACLLQDYCDDCGFEEIDAQLQSFCVQFFVDVLVFLYDMIKEGGDISKYLQPIDKFAGLVQTYSNESFKFCNKINATKNGIKVFFDFIQNQTLLAQFIESGSFTFYDPILSSILNLSKVENKFKSVWQPCEPIKSCIHLSDQIGLNAYKGLAYLTISNIADDSEINTLPEIKNAIAFITKFIEFGVEAISSDEGPEKMKIQIHEGEEKEDICVCYGSDGDGYHLVELLTGLYRLSVNDNIKKDIFEVYQMKNHLKTLIMKGNEVEKEYSLRLLYQLCFNEEIAKELHDNIEFFELLKYFEELAKDTTLKRPNIKKHIEGIFWKVESKDKEKVEKILDTPTTTQLMISYNSQSRDLCLAIKSELEKCGYKVWIDVEQIHGSSLESMANAIEESAAVLMCMTEKYKLSSNCRLEAEYSTNLNKPIVPLILQKDYRPDGWLGLILGSKMFVNFKKYDFEECIRRLKGELNHIVKKSPVVEIKTTSMPTSAAPIEPKTNSVLSWSVGQVNEWLDKKEFHPYINDNIRDSSGKILQQMYLMQQKAPEAFYTCLMRTNPYKEMFLKDMAYLAHELNALFA